MKVVTIIGARPQIIKASVVSQELRARGVEEFVIHTGQHYDSNMSDVFFSELGIAKPCVHLGIGGGTHGEMTGRMLVEIEKCVLQERPDLVLVYGDTNSTLAGALVAAKLNIPVAHVEAGLRSFNMRMPEEINRILTDNISEYLFCPTAEAQSHLIREGIDRAKIHVVGDVMFDVAIVHGAKASTVMDGPLSSLRLEDRQFVLATIHRAENTDNEMRLAAIVEGFNIVAESMPLVWPLHPRTRAALNRLGLFSRLSNNILVIEPQGYLSMVQLEKFASVIATDSGGVQKEAFFHGVPCVTLRDETEWTELVDAGWNTICAPSNPVTIGNTILSKASIRGNDISPYGSGDAAEKIVEILVTNVTKCS